MKTALKIFAFTIVVTGFYSYVGQMVPQKETYPPASTELNENMTTEELVAAGEKIVQGKGTCLGCHTIGSEGGSLRFPDLAGVGARAGKRKEGYSDVEYLAESLYEPSDYVVEGFAPGKPTISRPPINLSDAEILAVIAYLQSLGGTPSVTPATKLKWQGRAPAPKPAASSGGGSTAEPRSGEEIFQSYLCNTCHNIDKPGRLVGPSLVDVGSRLTKAQIYEAVMDPDATIVEGYPAGLMSKTIASVGFPDVLSTAELRNLVDFLASQKGG
ncbi:MAG: c-type cytochrome [Rhodothermales bacterium]